MLSKAHLVGRKGLHQRAQLLELHKLHCLHRAVELGVSFGYDRGFATLFTNLHLSPGHFEVTHRNNGTEHSDHDRTHALKEHSRQGCYSYGTSREIQAGTTTLHLVAHLRTEANLTCTMLP